MAAQSFNNARTHSGHGAQSQQQYQELKVERGWMGTVFSLLLALVAALVSGTVYPADDPLPHIVLVMSDDQGWGETGYYSHPVLRTPNLDAMAAAGLRLDRFYAGAPNCSPTRATVLTGRTNDRSGVVNHGFPLRLQEVTVAQALRDAGYATGHFGKWHLSGIRGAGVPVLAGSSHHPGAFGFDEWLSVTNYFDMNPILGRMGQLEEFRGDSSEVMVAEALEFIRKHVAEGKPTFTVIWFGSPHDPWVSSAKDRAAFQGLTEEEQHHYGELVAMDRSIGTLRAGLQEMGIAGNTLVWFNSDNGGLQAFGPASVGGLRGWKDSLHEGGLRVPAIIEWPRVISPRITEYPAATLDIFPTLADIAGLPASAMPLALDGTSLKPLFNNDLEHRDKPLAFRHRNRGALIDNNYKILTENVTEGKYQLFDLTDDPLESQDIAVMHPDEFNRLVSIFKSFNESVEASVAGRDYPSGGVDAQPQPRYWKNMADYGPYLDQLRKRPEYKQQLDRSRLERLWLRLHNRLRRLGEGLFSQN